MMDPQPPDDGGTGEAAGWRVGDAVKPSDLHAPAMTDLSTLADRWRDRAVQLERFAPAAATAFRDAAAELAVALEEAGSELLPPDVASRESGYSVRRLAELRAEGRLTNHGTVARPRYRRCELPMKVGHREAVEAGIARLATR